MLGLDVAEAFLGRGPQAASGGPVQAVPKSALDSSPPSSSVLASEGPVTGSSFGLALGTAWYQGGAQPTVRVAVGFWLCGCQCGAWAEPVSLSMSWPRLGGGEGTCPLLLSGFSSGPLRCPRCRPEAGRRAPGILNSLGTSEFGQIFALGVSWGWGGPCGDPEAWQGAGDPGGASVGCLPALGFWAGPILSQAQPWKRLGASGSLMAFDPTEVLQRSRWRHFRVHTGGGQPGRSSGTQGDSGLFRPSLRASAHNVTFHRLREAFLSGNPSQVQTAWSDFLNGL